MKNYLDDAGLSTQQKQVILPILEQPYSSLVNVLFTRALGKNGESWRSFRIGKVLEQAKDWAVSNGVQSIYSLFGRRGSTGILTITLFFQAAKFDN